MESDEEYMSAMSSDDEIMQDYSGDEISAGEGEKPHRPLSPGAFLPLTIYL